MSDHYSAISNLTDRLRQAIEDQSDGPFSPTTRQLSGVDEFHLRGPPATETLIDLLNRQAHDAVLDIGSGLGGPARHFAERTGCRVTGIDFTPSFVAAAQAMSDWTGLQDRTRFLCADATKLPFDDGSFDAAYSIHVSMNIADKAAMFREAHRVLRPGGRLLFYDVVEGTPKTPLYPTPWATASGQSHLVQTRTMIDALQEAGFIVDQTIDWTALTLEWFTEMATKPPQPLNLSLVMGPDFGRMTRNLRSNLERGEMRVVVFTAAKAG